MKIFSQSRWIWNGDLTTENQHVCFRTTFDYRPSDGTPLLHLAVDSDFVAYLNGVRIGQGQLGDWPEEKTYSTFPVGDALRPGRNTVAILAYYRGRGFSMYAPGRPGMIVEFGNVVSNNTWRCRRHPAFVSGEIAVTTLQVGFCAAFDARRDDDWMQPGFDDSGWDSATEISYPTGYRDSVVPRPVPPLRHLPPLTTTVVMQGHLWRREEKETFAASVAADLLTSRSYRDTFILPPDADNRRPTLTPQQPAGLTFRPLSEAGLNGYFAVADVGAESAGLLRLGVTAPAGTVCDLAVGEHLDDGRVRAKIGGRSFSDRYICQAGKNEFQFPFRRVAGRYVEIHVTGMGTGTVTLNYLGLTPTELDLPETAGFTTEDRLTNRRYEIAARTLALCMHEHYEDCPWREQSLYAYDSRNQVLYGYYRWGNYAFARASLDLLGRGIRPDGLLQLCAPCRMDLTIPIFSFVWVAEVAEYELFSGDTSLFDRYRNQIAAMIETVLPLHDSATGLFRLREEKYLWNFYEWTAGLDGCPFGTRIGIQAGFNLYFYEMIGVYLELLARRGEDDTRLAKIRPQLASAIHARFWNEEKQAYASILDRGVQQGFHEHIQALALYNRIVPPPLIPAVLKTLQRRQFVPISYSAMSYLIRVLMELGPDARRQASDRLTEAFEPLILSGATSLWETALGAVDFEDAGSLCHAWSSIDVYFDHAEVLGIKPLDSGFTRFAIAPYPDHFYEANGTIATPHGNITVSWHRREDGLAYVAAGPDTLVPELRLYPEVPIASVTYNGRRIK